MIEHPTSWSVKPPDRPNVVTNLLSNSGTEVLVILVNKFPSTPNASELSWARDLMASAEGLESMPGNNHFIAGSNKTVIDGEPSSMVKYSTVKRVLDTDLVMFGLIYTIFYKDFGVTLMFYAADIDENRARTRYAENEILFKRMAASFILLSKYSK